MRCRDCDELLSEFELRLKQENGTPEDICVRCKILIRECLQDTELHIDHVPYYVPEDTFPDYSELDFFFTDDDDEDY